MPRRAPDWMSSYLRALGAPDTKQNRSFLTTWQKREGGHTANDARFNYMNTTQSMPGSSSMNSVGVQRYRSLGQGSAAFARTLRNGRYADLLQGIRSGDPYKARPVAGLATWLSGSPQSASGLSYARQVLGTRSQAPPPVPGLPSLPGAAPGGRPRAAPGVRAPGSVSLVQQRPNFRALANTSLNNYIQGTGSTDPFDVMSQMASMAAKSRGSSRWVNKPATVIRAPGAPGGKLPVQVQGKMTAHDRKAIQLAQHYLGTPYSWGGGGPSGPTRGIAQGARTVGFDCSGLIEYVWAKNGVQVGGTTYEQIKRGMAVNPTTKSLRPGDAVFFGDPKAPHHVGMFIGNGKFIEAPHTGAVVRISKLAGRQPSAARRYG